MNLVQTGFEKTEERYFRTKKCCHESRLPPASKIGDEVSSDAGSIRLIMDQDATVALIDETSMV